MIRPVSTSGSTATASTPWVHPRRNPSEKSPPIAVLTMSMSGAFAASTSVGVARAESRLSRVSDRLAPTRLCAMGSMRGRGSPPH